MVAASTLDHHMMLRLIQFGLTAVVFAMAPAIAERHVVIVEGLGGEATYTEAFARDVERIANASTSVTDADNVLTLRAATRSDVIDALGTMAQLAGNVSELTLYLVGHGSYDDVEYRFNLAGPDLTGNDLVDALAAQSATTIVIVNTSSASGVLQESLEADERVLLLATRSGKERHATRFGGFFTEALSSDAADIDKNKIITVTEAFRFAERGVADYFERNVQLATEHSVLVGSKADRFALARLDRQQTTQSTNATPTDAALDELLAERDAINAEIETLRLARDSIEASQYRSQLLELTLGLARAEDAIEAREEELGVR